MSLTGEIVIAEANNVLKFAPLKANRTGISGTLFVTNFKVSFVTLLPVDSKVRLPDPLAASVPSHLYISHMLF